MSRVTNGDLAVLSANSVDLLALIENVSYRPSVDTVDGKSLPRGWKTGQAMGFGGEFQMTMHSHLSAPTRVSHLDISALTIDGTAYRTMLVGGRLSVAYEVKPGKAAGDWWRVPVVTDKDASGTINFMVPLSGTANVLRDTFLQMHSATPADLNMSVSFTINAVPITVGKLLTGGEVTQGQGDLLNVSCSFIARGTDSGTYPAAPSGSTTLMEKAFNAPGTPIAFSFTPHDAVGEGANWAGNMVYGGYEVTFNRDELVLENYTFLTTGVVTQTNA